MVDSIQGLRPDGRLVTMGADAEPISVSLIDLISKRIRIIGSQQNGPEYLYEGLDFVVQGKVKTIVETYPLAEAPKAYDRVCERQGPVSALSSRCSRSLESSRSIRAEPTPLDRVDANTKLQQPVNGQGRITDKPQGYRFLRRISTDNALV
jgi:hypothetical protein